VRRQIKDAVDFTWQMSGTGYGPQTIENRFNQFRASNGQFAEHVGVTANGGRILPLWGAAVLIRRIASSNFKKILSGIGRDSDQIALKRSERVPDFAKPRM
jgi:hypothetical protein